MDNVSEKDLKNIEKRDDGKFEILDVKLDNRKTKNLDKVDNKKIDLIENSESKLISTNLKKQNTKLNENFTKNINENLGKRFSMPDRRKGYIQKASIGNH